MADLQGRAPGDPLLTALQFRMLFDRVQDYCGLRFGPDAYPWIERRVIERIECLGGLSVNSYLYALREGPEARRELEVLVDLLSAKDTFFFREEGPLRALVQTLVTDRPGRAEGRPVRLWSAGCASGEEPYTIAMLALEAGAVLGQELEIFGSDIALSALTRARRGCYALSSLHATPVATRDRYVEEREGQFRVCSALREQVDIVVSNLMEANRVDWLGALDVIVCRNVLDAFAPESRDRVLADFYDRLCPGGILLVGAGERWDASGTDFEPVQMGDGRVYRRPEVGERSALPWRQKGEPLDTVGALPGD